MFCSWKQKGTGRRKTTFRASALGTTQKLRNRRAQSSTNRKDTATTGLEDIGLKWGEGSDCKRNLRGIMQGNHEDCELTTIREGDESAPIDETLKDVREGPNDLYGH